jgi:hypothetical protein
MNDLGAYYERHRRHIGAAWHDFVFDEQAMEIPRTAQAWLLEKSSAQRRARRGSVFVLSEHPITRGRAPAFHAHTDQASDMLPSRVRAAAA